MKKTTIALTLAAVFAVAGCQEPTNSTKSTAEEQIQKVEKVSAEQANISFDEFKHKFIDDFWKLNPGYAVYVGNYKHDDILPVPNNESRQKSISFAKTSLTKLGQFDTSLLNPTNASDYHILKNRMESMVWYGETFKSHEWNPSNYNVAGVFGVILNTDYKAKDERLRTIFRRLENVPAYYEAAKATITQPTIPHTELAISQNKGALGLFEKSIAKAVTESSLTDDEKKTFEGRLGETSAAINSYVSFLEGKLAEIKENGTARDFRIGEALYNKKFPLDIFSGYSAKELYEKALAEKKRVHGEIIKISQQLWPKYFKNEAFPEDALVATKKLIDHISVKHVERDKFVDSIRQQIPELEAFVMEKGLLEMDPEKPLVVRETPEYQRGFAGASINAPGPYDAKANTYYNVTPLDNYSDEDAESYLREYNHWLLQILNIHEAVPGHYTQLVHSNKSPSLVKAVFYNGAMIEGWAVYTERMMLEEGYGDFEPELWLMYYKWNLRVIINAILDYELHVKGLTEEGALDLMINQGFQEKAEAQGKWRRATLSQVQLTSYFTGYSEIYELREKLKEKTGDKFNLANFHNHFLSFGSSPVPIIGELMTEEFLNNHK